MARPTKKNPLGKQIKPKLDDENTIKKLEEAFSWDCTIEEACLHADISKQWYYDLLQYKPKLVDRFEALRNNPVLKARAEVVKGFTDNPDLALKYLERKRKNEFSQRTEVEVTTTDPLKQRLSQIKNTDAI